MHAAAIKRGLILIDIQKDFMPGGALPVPHGDAILYWIEKLLSLPFDLKIATKDWHPREHGSFAQTHGKKVGDTISLQGIDQFLWPVHCVQNSEGADFAGTWNPAQLDKIIYKGTHPSIDSYSAFFDNGRLHATDLAEYLKNNQIEALYFAGLATDYCVQYSVLDALRLGFSVFVIKEACRGVDLHPGDSERALDAMQAAGAKVLSFDALISSMAPP